MPVILKHRVKGIKDNKYEFLEDVADIFRFMPNHLVPEGSKKTELEFNILAEVYACHVMYLDILLNTS